jgi:hypothetical protein
MLAASIIKAVDLLMAQNLEDKSVTFLIFTVRTSYLTENNHA